MLQKIKLFFKKANENIIPLIIFIPPVLIWLIECLHRRTVSGGLSFIMEAPVSYGINVLLMMCMLSLCLIFRERLFWLFFISLVWLILGIINCLVLCNRVSPFSFSDIKVLSSVASIIRQYMGISELSLTTVAFVFCVIFVIYLRRRIPKINRRKHMIRDFVVFIVFVLCGIGSSFAGKKLFHHTGNITLTYLNHGFVYCFSNSIFDSGIHQPIDYSERRISTINKSLKKFDPSILQETDKTPNIIFVQLESHFDVNNMRYYSYSQDPMPYFHSLIKKYSSGLLNVPTLGAGTVNTEFEILTGMSMDYFGLCEYPYKSVLKKQTCESLAYNLQEEGYATAVIHNNRGTFYSRNQVFKNLGFDVFDAIEFMDNIEYNSTDWVKDSILPGQIIERIKSTEEKDFIYTITVQSHGKYPSEAPEKPYAISLVGEKDEKIKNSFEYYVNECYEVDLFIKDLIAQVRALKEDTVIVFFGDHLPTLEITDSDLQYQNTYQTTYVIWDNFGLEKKDKNLRAYQLSSHVMGKLGYKRGVLTRFHLMYANNPFYERNLHQLQYDMLYGQKYIYGQVDPYTPSELQYGLYPITLDKVRQGTDVVVVTGEHFTEASRIYINGHKQETKYVDENALLTYGYELEDGDRIRVRQQTSTGGKIGTTEEYIYQVK